MSMISWGYVVGPGAEVLIEGGIFGEGWLVNTRMEVVVSGSSYM
jgi:hypothetical protein